MYTSVLLFVLVIALWSDSAFGCNKRRPPPPPPPPPPPNSPPPPPPPPPIVKVIRQREQVMSRNNCKKVAITTATDSNVEAASVAASAEDVQRARQQLENEGYSDQCLNAEEFKYECEFSVYSEIALTTIYHPTGCGCAFTIQVIKPRPRLPDVANLMSVNAAYSTKVTRFSLVVYDIVADKVEAEIPEFSNMALSPETTAMIEAQVAADPNGDFSSITAGFAGTVKSFPKLPAQLNKNDPANANYIPAVMFTIQQTYTTGAMFKVPCHLKMHTAPNAYMSQCQPYRKGMEFEYSKRHSLEVEEVENKDDVAWFREFYLFPKQEAKGCGRAASGYTPKSRYITSFYADNQCMSNSGYMSFDREFQSTFEASNAVVGGWKWTRTFEDARVVFGVPHAFSSLTSVWCLGYSQINWVTRSDFEPSQVPVERGICKALPTSWTPETQVDKYEEQHPSYPADAEGLDCSPSFTPKSTCPSDTTLLGFQNRDPRDFEKRPRSTLLTGPRRLFCSNADQEGADRVVFDTLTFRGVKAGEALAKRNWDDSAHPQPHEIHMVYSDEHDGLLHGRHAPELVAKFNAYRRKRAETPMFVDPVAAPAGRDNFVMNTAAGTVDIKGSNGAPAGDHPLRVFPENYNAPLTLDPVQSESENEPLVYDGELVTGVPPKFCKDGELGCVCRPAESHNGQCDLDYECNTLGYCAQKPCPEGKPGCDVHSDGTCDDDLIPSADKKCIYKPNCTAGDMGCTCKADETCSSGKCLDGFCLADPAQASAENLCAGGEPGCSCASDGSCLNGSSCSDFGVCLFQVCTPGTPGCACQRTGTTCSSGFTCGSDQACIASTCVVGDPGCACAKKSCNKKGFSCVDLDRSGSLDMCVGQDLCAGEQSQRCNDECGPGNVAFCPKCAYAAPICYDESIQACNKGSRLYGIEPCDYGFAPASHMTVSMLFAALAAFVALF